MRISIQRFAVAQEILTLSHVLLTMSENLPAIQVNVRTSMTLILTSIPLPVNEEWSQSFI